jgi:diguanylate cyclase (GGDEF)-like protein/putative nucleotidyltransferase with HDIG domain
MQSHAKIESEPIRVLALDDEESIRQVYSTVLASPTSSIQTVGNCREALRRLMQHTFDVLVVDLKMPGMDGLTFLNEAMRIWPWLGVVIVSGYVNDDTIEKARELGVTRVLHKPIRAEVLRHSVLAEAESARARSASVPEPAFTRLFDHLKLLTWMGQEAIRKDTLAATLQEMGRGLAQLVPTSVVAVLGVEEEQNAMVLTAREPVSPEFVERVSDEMLARYAVLSGESLSRDSLRVQIEGVGLAADGPSSVGSTLSVPVIMGDEVRGLLTLASVEAKAYTHTEGSLLYHAANHIGAVFASLKKVKGLSARDPLTGVMNRLGLEEAIDREWLLSRRYGYSVGVVVLDVDHFKSINDSYGHTVGDQILREFSRVVERVARASDTVARYGGDEFVAILPRADETAARAFGERLLKSTREYVFCRHTHEMCLTVSVGIATSLNPTAPATGAALLNQADRALYMAKRAGRNRMCIWPEQSAPKPAATTADTPRGAAPTEAAPRSAGRILVVDDDPAILSFIEIILKRDGYHVSAFTSAQAVLEAVRRAGHDEYDLLLTDLRLPGKDGIELLHEVEDLNSDLVKIVMTGYATVDNAVHCLREGAYDFVEKPIDREQLRAVVERALEYRFLRVENSRYQVHLQDLVQERSAQLAATLEEVKKSHEFTLEAMVAMLDAREKQTAQHSHLVREFSVTLGRHVGLHGDDVETLARGALLHDIGKISIPDAILLKPSRLTPDEWQVMRRHAEYGYNLLCSSHYLRDAAAIVYSHHERYDGTGYPRALKGEEICLGARIFAVADAYEAMRSHRVYRRPIPPDKALAEVLQGRGTQFDPAVVDVFKRCQPELEEILRREAGTDPVRGRIKAGSAPS